MIVVALAAGSAVAIVLLFWLLMRGPTRMWALEPLLAMQPLRRVHLLAFAAVAVYLTGLTVGSGYVARQRDKDLTQQILTNRLQDIRRNQLSRYQITQIAMRTARLEAPTEDDLIHLLAHVDEICLSSRCKVRFARTVRNLVRVQAGRIVPALPGAPPAARQPRLPPPAPSAPQAPVPQVPQPPASRPVAPDPRVARLVADVARLRIRVDRLSDRKPVDSTAIDAVDETVRRLETAVGALGSRIERLTDGLCRSSLLTRLLTGLGVCR